MKKHQHKSLNQLVQELKFNRFTAQQCRSIKGGNGGNDDPDTSVTPIITEDDIDG